MDYYLMPVFTKLMVKDTSTSSKWYQEKLDFTSLFQFKNNEGEVIMEHLRGTKYQDIMLLQADDFSVGNGQIINFSVEDISKIEKNMDENEVVEELKIQPWNATEMTIRDCNGYLITLTQTNKETQQSFDTVIQETKNNFF